MGLSKARLETLTDGVFAIAITILALTIAQPSDYNRLAHELGESGRAGGKMVLSVTGH